MSHRFKTAGRAPKASWATPGIRVNRFLARWTARQTLPRGCLNADSDEGWDAICDQPLAQRSECEHALDDGFERWISKVERQICDISGLDGRSRATMCCRALGPRLVMQPLLGKPGSCSLKASPITIAWKTLAGWLVDVLAGFGERCPSHAKTRAAQSRRHILRHSWRHLGDGVHAVAFRTWAHNISVADLENRKVANWLRASVMLIAKRAGRHDA